jgi:protein SCO1/2
MNEPRLSALLSLPLALALAACSPAGGEEPPLKGARIGGTFTLTDQDGRQVSDSQFAGKYRIVYFGYTYCPDVCPVDLQNIGKGLREFEKSDPARAARIQPIFISVDPERDTPAVMKQYVAAFHPRLIGLTGSRPQIEEVAKKFATYGLKTEEKGSTEYLVNHPRMAVLMGPGGEPIAQLRSDEGPDAVVADLRKWVA